MDASSRADVAPDAPLCPHCGGAGWLRQEAPVGHPDFGRPIPCVCKAAVIKQQRLAHLYDLSRLGDNLRGMTFETFLTRDIPYEPALVPDRTARERIFKSLETAARFARNYAEEPDSWLVLLGDYGCGKTHLAVAIANARLERGEPVLFQVVPDLLDHLRATFAPASTTTYDELFEEVRSAPLLILDDLGAHSSSPWAEEKLFQLVNHRNNYRLPTVVTTNVPLDRLEPRLVSRMTHAGRLLRIVAPDFRGGLSAPRSAGAAPVGRMPPSLRARYGGA